MILSKTSFFEEGDCFACIQEESEIDAANSTVLRKVEGSADRLPMLKGCCFPAASRLTRWIAPSYRCHYALGVDSSRILSAIFVALSTVFQHYCSLGDYHSASPGSLRVPLTSPSSLPVLPESVAVAISGSEVLSLSPSLASCNVETLAGHGSS